MTQLQPVVTISVSVLWKLRDLVHHFGVHHPAVRRTPTGDDISRLGEQIPDLAHEWRHARAAQVVEPIFKKYGWESEEITLESVLDLADSLMLPPFDPARALQLRRQRREHAQGRTT